MPPSRASHSRVSKQSRQAENATDTEDDTEPETPKPPLHRSLSKKRLSDVYDASFTSDSGRVPLKSVNINDDAAEKRRRRKSAKIILPENAEAGPSDMSNPDDKEDRAMAQGRQKQQHLSVAQAPILDVPLDVVSSKFEEWMKMATDNVRSNSK